MSLKTLYLTNCWHAGSGGSSTISREMLRTAERLVRPMLLVAQGKSGRVEERGRSRKFSHSSAGNPFGWER